MFPLASLNMMVQLDDKLLVTRLIVTCSWANGSVQLLWFLILYFIKTWPRFLRLFRTLLANDEPNSKVVFKVREFNSSFNWETLGVRASSFRIAELDAPQKSVSKIFWFLGHSLLLWPHEISGMLYPQSKMTPIVLDLVTCRASSFSSLKTKQNKHLFPRNSY